MVAVHKTSEKMLVEANRLVGSLEMSRYMKLWVKRFWRSCDEVKIRFGDNNFLDTLTPLRCMDTSMNLTVQVLLLLGSGK